MPKFAEVIDDLISLYESGKEATTERKAQLFDQIGPILRRAFSEEQYGQVAGLPLGYTQTTWVESDVA